MTERNNLVSGCQQSIIDSSYTSHRCFTMWHGSPRPPGSTTSSPVPGRGRRPIASLKRTRGRGEDEGRCGDGVASPLRGCEERRSHVGGRIIRFVGFEPPAPVVGSQNDSNTLVKVLDNFSAVIDYRLSKNQIIDANRRTFLPSRRLHVEPAFDGGCGPRSPIVVLTLVSANSGG